ncbi:MAG: HIT family protein [Halobacteriovoraceae bacterium]|nr:HIT family protein [Halobacteriovoraceae bacterium]|tara:strand:- start:2548 stop:2940 length:393 start_codon:yes stop_codon:yes gene_type:complete
MNLHPQLEKDSLLLGDLELSQLRIIPDGELTWFLLIPRKDDLIDWDDLSLEDQKILCEEISFVSLKMKEFKSPDKINVASLGNMVSQLHIHVIARYKSDRAWPKPVWGTTSEVSFKSEEVQFWQNLLGLN